MKDYITFEKFKRELFKDPEIKKEYDRLEPEYKMIRMFIQKRIDKKMSQADLAKKVGTKQSAISRLESGDYNPSIAFLRRVAAGLGAKLELILV